MGRFDNKGFVVTGGASGIGEATTRGLVAEGGRVVVADLQAERGEALVAELGPAVVFIHTDVTREEDIENAVNLAVEQFGHLDGMVNNAGIVGAIGSIRDTSIEAYDHTMAILSLPQALPEPLAQCRLDPFRCKGNQAQPDTHRIEDGIGNRRRYWPHRPLPYPHIGLPRPIDQDGIDLRRVLKTQNRVAVPIATGDAVLVKCHLLLQRPAGSLQERTLKLVADAVRIDNLSGIACDEGFL